MRNPSMGVEKLSLAVTGLFFAVNMLIGQTQVAVGVAVGGALFLADYVAIRFVVRALSEKRYTLAFSIFIIVTKLLALLGIVTVLLMFAKLNIYGLLIGLTSVVIVIIGKGLKG